MNNISYKRWFSELQESNLIWAMTQIQISDLIQMHIPWETYTIYPASVGFPKFPTFHPKSCTAIKGPSLYQQLKIKTKKQNYAWFLRITTNDTKRFSNSTSLPVFKNTGCIDAAQVPKIDEYTNYTYCAGYKMNFINYLFP